MMSDALALCVSFTVGVDVRISTVLNGDFYLLHSHAETFYQGIVSL